MLKGSTESNQASPRRLAIPVAALVAFVLVGMASGLWIHVGILAVTVGIFMATVTMRRNARSESGGGTRARVISIAPVNATPLEDLDEVA